MNKYLNPYNCNNSWAWVIVGHEMISKVDFYYFGLNSAKRTIDVHLQME